MATAAGAEGNAKKARAVIDQAELKYLLGNPVGESFIVRASDYLAASCTKDEFYDQTKAWQTLLDWVKGGHRMINADSVKNGMAIYRKMGRLPSYFVGDEKLNLINSKMLGELKVVVDLWLTLDLKSDLLPLLKSVGRNYSPDLSNTATLLRDYMDAHKQESGFNIWTMDLMISLQYKVSRVVQEKVGRGKRSQSSVELPATKRQKVTEENVAVTGVSKLVENPPQEGNCAVTPESSSGLDKIVIANFPNAIKVEQSYQSSKATYQSTKKAWKKATKSSSTAMEDFRLDLDSAWEAIVEHLQIIDRHTTTDSWPLALARESFKEFQDKAKDLVNCFKEYVEALEIEQQTKEDNDVARAKFLEWEKKRAIVEQAVKAIQALKDL